MLKLSGTSVQGLISKERDLKPFWNGQSEAIASHFTLPVRTDYDGSDMIISDGLSEKQAAESWFSIKLFYHPNQSLPEIYSASCISFPVECADLEITVSRLIRLSPTSEQKKIFRIWTDISRWVFNWTIGFIRSCVNFTPSWMDVKKYATRYLPAWTKSVPFQIKGIAIKEACDAFWKAKGKPAFRTRKNPEQSCFIPKTALKSSGIYPRVSGNGLKFHEVLPENPADSRLIWRNGKWWISVPSKKTISRSDNQAGGIVAIDPGVRTFAAFYSPGMSGKIGEGDFARIYRLLLHLDKLYSRRSKADRRNKKTLTKAIRRMTAKVRNLITELHWKTAHYLCERFSLILMPTYETKQMICKSERKIASKTVRSMLGFANYKFKNILKWMALKLGVTVLDVSEAYTSRTHPQTGEIRNIGSAKWIKLKDGSVADRDIVGAYNILIKFLTECCTLGDTPAVCN